MEVLPARTVLVEGSDGLVEVVQSIDGLWLSIVRLTTR